MNHKMGISRVGNSTELITFEIKFCLHIYLCWVLDLTIAV